MVWFVEIFHRMKNATKVGIRDKKWGQNDTFGHFIPLVAYEIILLIVVLLATEPVFIVHFTTFLAVLHLSELFWAQRLFKCFSTTTHNRGKWRNLSDDFS